MLDTDAPAAELARAGGRGRWRLITASAATLVALGIAVCFVVSVAQPWIGPTGGCGGG